MVRVTMGLRQRYQQAIYRRAVQLQDEDLQRPTIIFSPHQDDETLGCGGTIIRKTRLGADVTVVFMTDGRHSHSQLMPAPALKQIRAQEALAAGHLLGVKPQRVLFLEFEDGTLRYHQQAATRTVHEVLLRYQPADVFLPYAQETPPDHAVTNTIVRAALRQYRRAIMAYEYPIWGWHHWPWIPFPAPRQWRQLLTVGYESLVYACGLRLLRDLRWAVYIGDLLDQKRVSLAQYRSQMTRLLPDPRWPTLPDVARGEFLARFFQEYEVFRCYRCCGEKEPLTNVA